MDWKHKTRNLSFRKTKTKKLRLEFVISKLDLKYFEFAEVYYVEQVRILALS